MIVGLRRGAVNTGKWENSHGSELFVTLERQGNALGFPPSDREKFIEKNGLPYFDGTQEYCLWMGCLGSFDPNGRKILLALVEVLQSFGNHVSAFCGRKSAVAIRCGGWGMIICLANWRREIWRTFARVE